MILALNDLIIAPSVPCISQPSNPRPSPSTPIFNYNISLDPKNLRDKITHPWFPPLRKQLPDFEFLDCTKAHMNLCTQEEHFDHDEIHYYADGSGPHHKKDFGHVDGAFAVAVFQHSTKSKLNKFIGYFVSNVCTDPVNKFYIGAATDTSDSAELSAIVWIQLHILSQLNNIKVTGIKQIHIFTDSQWSINITTNFDQYHTQPILSRMSQALQHVTSIVTHVQYTHVKGHSGDPANELVDKLCTALQQTAVPLYSTINFLCRQCGCPVHCYSHNDTVHYIDFLFLFFLPTTQQQSYPPAGAGSFLVARHCARIALRVQLRHTQSRKLAHRMLLRMIY